MDFCNDRPEVPASIEEIADQVVLFCAEDRPRYVTTNQEESGYLGFEEFPYPSKPVFSSKASSGGSLESDKYYSIYVAPFNKNIAAGGLPINGNASGSSIPVQPTEPSTETRTATGAGADSIAVSNPTGTTFRYTLGANLSDFVSPDNGTLVATGFTETGNNVTGETITAVDSSSRWIEITNASGVAETDDINCSVVVTPAPSTVSSITFAVPTHPQMRVEDLGDVSSQAGFVISDTSQAWTVDALIGKTLFNVETGLSDTITDNDATTITTTSLAFNDADRYQVQTSFTTYRAVYAAEWASADGAAGLAIATFYLNGVIADNSTTTYTLSTHFTAETFLGDAYQPPNASFCHAVGDVLYAAGSLDHEDVGTVTYNGTAHTHNGSSEVVAVAEVDSYDSIFSFTLVTATFGDIVIGSYVTITGSENTGENDVEDVRILWVSSDAKTFHIANTDGVVNTDDATMTVTLTPNYIAGTSANFTAGMKDAYVNLTESEFPSAQIVWVDTVNQKIGLNDLMGDADETPSGYKIWQSYHIYYSDFRNPHRWKATSIVEIGDDPVALDSIGKHLIIICKGSIWRWDTLEPGAAPEQISNNIMFDAPWSVCSTSRFVIFFDGEGFSYTDGITLQSVTMYKARDYLAQVHKAYAHKIQGVYDRQNGRFIFSMPMGNEVLCNYGLYITEGSWNCTPFSRPDCNALFTGYEDGDLAVYHGTSGDFSDGYGQVWRHEGHTDGMTGTEYQTVITDITGQVITVTADGDVTWARGSVVTAYPVAGGTYQQMIIEAVTETSTTPYTYEITFDSAYDLSGFDELDYILFGMIPFDYGIKWTDFSSPQYLNRVRTLHFDIFGMTGKFWCDQYLDLNETPKQTTLHEMLPTTFKVVIPFKYGYGYVHGFRIRGFSSTEFKINGFERIFEVKV